MKRLTHLLYLFATLLPLAFLASCSDDDDTIFVDITPTEVAIRLVDENGVNLLDPETEGNWYGQDMSIGYNDEGYDIQWTDSEGSYFPYEPIVPVFYGFRFTCPRETINGEYIPSPKNGFLSFGYFDGAKEHHMTLDFTIHEINTVYHIEYNYYCDWKNNDFKIRWEIYLNGELQPNGIHIVLPRRK